MNQITPAPNDEEAAAIAVAIEYLWPRAVVAAESAGTRSANGSAWRFSGRWWDKPVALRRDRP